MAEKEEVIKEKFNHTGIFDFKSFYSFMHSYLIDEKYGVIEEKYGEKVASGGNSRDVFFLWNAEKKLTDYFKINIEVEAGVVELSDVEVEIDGKRKKMNKGKIMLELKGVLVKDPDSKWDVAPTYQFFRDVYNKYVIPGRIYTMTLKVQKEVKLLKEEVKAFLDLYGQRGGASYYQRE